MSSIRDIRPIKQSTAGHGSNKRASLTNQPINPWIIRPDCLWMSDLSILAKITQIHPSVLLSFFLSDISSSELSLIDWLFLSFISPFWNSVQGYWFKDFWGGKVCRGNVGFARSEIVPGRRRFGSRSGFHHPAKLQWRGNLENLCFTDQGAQFVRSKRASRPVQGKNIERYFDATEKYFLVFFFDIPLLLQFHMSFFSWIGRRKIRENNRLEQIKGAGVQCQIRGPLCASRMLFYPFYAFHTGVFGSFCSFRGLIKCFWIPGWAGKSLFDRATENAEEYADWLCGAGHCQRVSVWHAAKDVCPTWLRTGSQSIGDGLEIYRKSEWGGKA